MINEVIKTNKVEAINDEQRLAVAEIIEFIKKGNSDEWFVLEGKAGTGKTTIVTKAIEQFVGKKRIDISALSHKAKKVLWDKLMSIYSECPIGLSSHSVASLLGMTFNLETGKFTKIYTKRKPPIRWADIIIVDEGSMINEEALALIMNEKKRGAKVIFLGDIGQLPPIRETDDPNSGNISPVFDTENKVTLKTRVRQGEDSHILSYSDYYWDNSVINEGVDEDPVPLTERTNKEQMIFTKNLEKILEDNKDKFIESNKNNDPNIIKVIVYRNNTKKAINWYIRNLIYGTPNEYEIGDMLILNDNYMVDETLVLENSSEVIINRITEKTFYKKFKGYTLAVTDGDRTELIDVISSDSIVDWNKHISSLFNDARKLFGQQRNKALKLAWNMKRRFADVDYAYTLTSHKSQGSTYKTVIVIEDDILGVTMINNVEKSQSMYTAITRASDLVYIVSELN